VRFVLGISGCLLAGCVATVRPSPMPAVASLAPNADPRPADALASLAPIRLPSSIPTSGTVLRIGIEHLPPDERLQNPGEPRVDTPKTPQSLPQFARSSTPLRREDVDAIRTHVLTSIDLDAIDDRSNARRCTS